MTETVAKTVTQPVVRWDDKSSRTLVGYAVLRANFDFAAPSYIENFMPFVLDALAQTLPGTNDRSGVAAYIRDTFGFTIPDQVVLKLLKRGAKDGLLKRVADNHFTLDRHQVALVTDITQDAAIFSRQQKELGTKFVEYVRTVAPDRIEQIEDGGVAVSRYIERHAVPLLQYAVSGKLSRTSDSQLDAMDFLAAKFIDHLSMTDNVAFGYLVDAVKGAILTAVVELGTGSLDQKLDRLTLVLDTPILLKALGYQGVEHQQAVGQTLKLASDLGAKLVCFEHTTTEIDGVLESSISVVRSRGSKGGVLRGVDAHFLETGHTPSDIQSLRNGLERNLGSLLVRVVSTPDEYHQYGLNEDELQATLQQVVGYQSTNTLRFDVLSISAVHRLRRGTSPSQFERCKYLFVTDNSRLVRATWGATRSEEHGWPLVMSDADLSALLWVRSPSVDQDVPRDRLLASVHAAMQPKSHFWSKYLKEIESLQAKRRITDEEALALRSSSDAHAAVMDETLGEDSALTDESVEAVLARLRNAWQEPAQAALAAAEHERDNAKAETDQTAEKVRSLERAVGGMERAQARQNRAIALAATRKARGSIRIPLALILVAAVASMVVQQFYPKVLTHLPDWVGIVVTAVAAIGLAITFVSGVLLGPVSRGYEAMERALSRRYERRARAKIGLAEIAEGEAEVSAAKSGDA